MSYILEALKQSEYARQQGKVPTLNTLPPMIQPPVEPPARRVLPYLLLAGVLLALAIVLAWWRPWPAAEQIRIIAAPYTAPPEAADAPAVRQQSPAHSPAPPAPVAQAAPTPVTPPQAEPAAAQPTPLPVPSPAAAMAEPAPPAAPSPARVEAVQPAAAPPVSPASPPRPPSRVLSFHELPAAVQERIPRLAVSGFSYAEEPGMRMAVVNDRILRQGDQASPGIVLERIASDGVIFSYQGYRFRPR